MAPPKASLILLGILVVGLALVSFLAAAKEQQLSGKAAGERRAGAPFMVELKDVKEFGERKQTCCGKCCDIRGGYCYRCCPPGRAASAMMISCGQSNTFCSRCHHFVNGYCTRCLAAEEEASAGVGAGTRN